MAMATATRGRHTPEELLSISDRLMPELIDGELVEREPLGQRLDALVANLVVIVARFADEHQLGVMNGGQGSYQVFPDDPDKVRIPDFSFTRRERLLDGRVEEGHGKVAPDLVGEMLTPSDRAIDVLAKTNDFLNAGVRLIWIIDPNLYNIHVLRSNRTGVIHRSGDVLDGGDVLPGFRCPLADLFKI
jgi:Uma2 family endonuclease